MRSGGLLFGLVACLLIAGAGRFAWLEHARGPQLREQARRQHSAMYAIVAQRGEILDARGRVLAGSVRRASVFADPTQVADPRFAAYTLGPVLDVSPQGLQRTLEQRAEDRFVWLKRELDDQELHRFLDVRSLRRLSGVGVQYEPRRVYPFGSLAAHVVGFVGAEPNQPGLAGIEQACQALLAGHAGRRSATVDVRRRRLRSAPEEFRPPLDGASVVLTIDAQLQSRTEFHLRNAVAQFKADWATAVLMDPLTGEVLAMATEPDFDPARPIPDGLAENERDRQRERLRNRAVSDAMEPGSIFKPFIAAPALDAGLTRLDEVFAINGPARTFGSRTIHDVHAYGSLALSEVISKSSNIGMGLLGARCGNDRLHEWIRRFGFGDPTGVGLPGEHEGMVNDFSRWTSFSTQSIPIGQEIAVTPLQLVTAFCALSNDGILYRPRLVRGVVSAQGEILLDNSRPIPLRRALSSRTAREFREKALAEAVRSGTGKKAAIPGFQVFGKTGTAQVARPGGHGYIPGAYFSSFVGGAPLGTPRVAIVVSLYIRSTASYYGGTVAAPTAGAILADALLYMRVPPELTPEQEVIVRKAVARPAIAAAERDDTAE
jgi:cell division protein FtsI (penicillin-binding protein 3)